ncbi:DNA translocase FtsK [bacterium]|nr:DNA translocase FtsK [bacterium]NUN46164.1 DNA translocase FtsK [bacterium]
MASKKKNNPKPKAAESPKGKIPQKPQPPKGLKLNLGIKLKEEIFGLLLMTVSLLSILSVVTHVANEQPGTIMELWRAGQLQNLLGPVGAMLSHYLVGYTFGYPFVAVPILFLVYGWLFFTHKSIFLVNQFAFYILTLMLIVSTWLAIPGALDHSENWNASGMLGGMLAHQLYTWLGGFGSVTIWVVFSLIWITMVTRVSIADLIPAIKNILFTSYRTTTGTISKFKSRQQELLEKESEVSEDEPDNVSEDAAEKPLIPEYLQKKTIKTSVSPTSAKTEKVNEPVKTEIPQVTTKQSTTIAPAIKEEKAPEELVAVQAKAEEPKRDAITGTDLGMDTQFVRDLKAIGHIDKKFSINRTKLEELSASAGHTDSHQDLPQEETTAPANTPVTESPKPRVVEPAKDLTIRPEDADLDMADADFKDLARSMFDAEHQHIEWEKEWVKEETAELERAKTRLDMKPARKPKTQTVKIEDIVETQEAPKEDIHTIVSDSTDASQLSSNDVNPVTQEEPQPEVTLPETAQEAEALAASVKAVKKEAPKPEPAIDFDKENSQARKKYKFPSIDLLEPTQSLEKLTPEEIGYLNTKVEQIIAKLAEFGIATKVVATEYGGPVVAIYQLELPSGLKISKITGLEDELALSLKVKSVRMVPVTSKGTIQVEIPKLKAEPVMIRSLFEDPSFRDAKNKYKLGLALGKTIDGHIHFEDLAKMPHLLIAGTTGAGKSVGINSIITSLLYQFDPSEVKFIMVDPKKVELALYRRLKNHHLISLRNHRGEVIEDVITKPENAKLILKALVEEMEERYEKLAEANVRNLEDYNKRWKEGRMPHDGKYQHYKLEYIVAIIDELADLMMTAPREIETSITRLAQMARAVGIHLIVATQRPSVDVLTGLIKANFPARIAYAVRSKIDSRTILDMGGAEQLLGKGDMLFMPPGQVPIRIQNAFTSTQETETIVDFINRMQAFPRRDFMVKEEPREENEGGEVDSSGFDELFNQAMEIVVKHNQGSASLLQRRLSVGYARAARLIDQLERAGIVSAPDGAKPRQVLITEDQMAMYMN